MNHNEKTNWLTNTFQFFTNLPRATVIGAMYYCDKPTKTSRLVLTGATAVAGLALGIAPAFAVAAVGLAGGGMAVQAFALPIAGVSRKNPKELLGTQEALENLNKSRVYGGKQPLRFPAVNI